MQAGAEMGLEWAGLIPTGCGGTILAVKSGVCGSESLGVTVQTSVPSGTQHGSWAGSSLDTAVTTGRVIR